MANIYDRNIGIWRERTNAETRAIRNAKARGRRAGERGHGSNPFDWNEQRLEHDSWANAYISKQGDSEMAVAGQSNGFCADVVATVCNHSECADNATLIALSPEIAAALVAIVEAYREPHYGDREQQAESVFDAMEQTGALALVEKLKEIL